METRCPRHAGRRVRSGSRCGGDASEEPSGRPAPPQRVPRRRHPDEARDRGECPARPIGVAGIQRRNAGNIPVLFPYSDIRGGNTLPSKRRRVSAELRARALRMWGRFPPNPLISLGACSRRAMAGSAATRAKRGADCGRHPLVRRPAAPGPHRGVDRGSRRLPRERCRFVSDFVAADTRPITALRSARVDARRPSGT